MIRLGINRITSVGGTRTFITSSAQRFQNARRYGLKSLMIQTMIHHQGRVNQSRIDNGIIAINHRNGNLRGIKTLTSEDSYEDRNDKTNQIAESAINRLERIFARFEERCQKVEQVTESDFVRTFDNFTKIVEEIESSGQLHSGVKSNLAMLSSILLRCCGRLMSGTPAEAREMLAGNAWQFTKEKKIPLDVSMYNILIKVLNENHTKVDPQKLLDEMKAANLEPDRITYQRLIHQYCVQGDIKAATSLLGVMKERDMEINEATFASLIIGYSMQDSPPSIDEMFELMKSSAIEPGSKSYAAAIISRAKLFKTDATKATEDMQKLIEMIKAEDIQFDVYEIGDILRELKEFKDNETVQKMIQHMTKSSPTNLNSRQRLLTVLLHNGQLEEASNQFWSREPTARARQSGRFGNYYIRMLATSKNIPIEHAITECSRLIETNANVNAFHQLYYLSANVGNLSMTRAALKKIGESETLKCHYFWPFLAQAKNNDEIISVLKNDLNPKMNSYGLLETFSDWVWPRFSDTPAMLIEINNKELKYDNGLVIASYLDYCVAENKIMEAVKFISELSPQETTDQPENHRANEDVDHEEVDDTFTGPNQNLNLDRGHLIGRLLNQIAEQTKDPVMVDKAFDLCKVSGLKVKSKILTPIMKVRIDYDDDFNSTLDKFLEISEKFNLTPCKFDLMIRCLDKKDSDSLQKIMDASSRIYGETNSLFDLACACLRCGRIKQANKILSSPGFRVHPNRVYAACKSLFRQQNLDMLENFVFATKDLTEVNQDYLYEILLEAYDRAGAQKRALDLWNRMQDEDFQPGKKILIQIARLLESKNISVPFQIPKTYSYISE